MPKLKDKLEQMANTPKAQFKQLAVGTLGAIGSMGLLWVSSQYESELIFYSLTICLVVCVAYALPGYLGIWLWRMRDTLFRQKNLAEKE
ncbi:hypothetical protein FLL45_08545 [Aliikangiella marina]|uniref:Uncharacterized protein n=1 Tax=Aliikangiella marina TaxID=1712262 RepID=A0A545TCR0_9GAMM|nr:hypothetical protein [Aliikangiella marina]TQV74981.1 hypothetical protein FLL45_08545 [Aliikangiella marina]